MREIDYSKAERGWKVVRWGLGTHPISCYYNTTTAYVSYPFGDWTHPRDGCGPLCVFDDVKEVEEFAGLDTKWEIYPCLFVRSAKQDWVWDDRGNRSPKGPFGLPESTVLADAVMLLREENNDVGSDRQ